MRPSSSNAISACVTWSRPCASERKASVRSQIPFHRPADLLRGPQRHHFLVVDENLGAETAADVGRDDAQFVLRRHADEGRNDEPRDVRILRSIPEREDAGAGIVLGGRHPRLHRIGNHAIVNDVEPGDVLGRFERGVDGLGVAEMPLIDRVVRRHLVNLYARLDCAFAGSVTGRQHLVVDLRPPRRRPSPAPASRRPPPRPGRRHSRPCRAASAGCGAIFIGEPSLEWIIQPQMRLPILSAASSAPVSTASTPGIAAAAAVSILLDPGMGVRRAHEHGVGLARPADVVGVVALAGDEAQVFLAAHRRADSGRAHGALLRWPLLLAASPRAVSAALPHGLGAGRDRLHDVVVAGAAADIAFELVADGLLVELVALAVHHIDRRHDHARRAEAALQAVVLAEGLLHRMQRAVRRRPALDGQRRWRPRPARRSVVQDFTALPFDDAPRRRRTARCRSRHGCR